MSGIYIHIPFCRQICHYCDFHHSASLASKEAMLAAIADELERRRSEIVATELRTLYFGGGTPSLCAPEQIAMLIDTVRRLWGVDHFDELTIEANPDDLTDQYLEAIRAAGVNRLSIGIQSFIDDHLERMNRRHTAHQAREAVRRAQRAGFDNITIDLMYGLPWMTPDEWAFNLEQAIDLGVQHISAYHLTIEPRTVFGKRGLVAVDDATSELHFDMLRRALCGAGFDHYEVSNFALAGCRAQHNRGYWSGRAYLGVGPSAHSYDGARCRSWNVSNNKAYLDGAEPQAEQLTDTDLLNEYLMTGLRTADGISYDVLSRRFGRESADSIFARCAEFCGTGQMVVGRGEDRTARITPDHFLISDYIISRIFE